MIARRMNDLSKCSTLKEYEVNNTKERLCLFLENVIKHYGQRD